MFIFILLLFSYNFLSLMPKKLLLLLNLELFYITSVFMFYLMNLSLYISSSFIILMLIMVVLDSVFGITLLICTSRSCNSSLWSCYTS